MFREKTGNPRGLPVFLGIIIIQLTIYQSEKLVNPRVFTEYPLPDSKLFI